MPVSLKEIAEAAVEVERTTSYPAEVLIAQWALESGWGKKVSGKNNYFGITYRPLWPDKTKRHTAFDWVVTREVLTKQQIDRLDKDEKARIQTATGRHDGKFDVKLERRFASYPSLADGITDYVKMLTSVERYQPAWKRYLDDSDHLAFLDGIAAAGYATDPNYASTLRVLAQQGNVKSALATAWEKATPSYSS